MTHRNASASCTAPANNALLFLVFLIVIATTSSDECNYDRYDRLRHQASSDEYVTPSVLRVTTTDDSSSPVTYDLRHFTSFLPFPVWTDSAVAALLGLHHFNSNISTVVPGIAEKTQRCPEMKFTVEFFNSEGNARVAFEHLSEDIIPRKGDATNGKPYPTAHLGPAYSSVSSPVALLSALHDIVQVSNGATSTMFDDKEQYPLFGRLLPSNEIDAYAAVDYLAHQLSVTHVGVLYIQDSYGTHYHRVFQEAASKVTPQPMNVISSSVAFDKCYANVAATECQLELERALVPLVQSGYKYVFAILFLDHFDAVMEEAWKAGIAGDDYFWLFTEGIHAINNSVVDADSPILSAAHGAGVFVTATGSILEGRRGYESFMNEWRTAKDSEELCGYFDSKMPYNASLELPKWDRNSVFDYIPTPYALHMYDAAIALMFAACDASSQSTNGFFDGYELYESFLKTTFDGAYGKVAFDPQTGNRDYRTFLYEVSNLLANDPDEESGEASFSLVTTHVYSREGSGGSDSNDDDERPMEWKPIEGTRFVYSDGTETPPDVLPLLDEDTNMISDAILAVGYVFCGIVTATSIGFGVWTYVHRKTRVIRSSQPLFLWMLCAGTVIMGSGIIPMGIQEPAGQTGLDVACMMVPWLVSIGFVVTFSALFSKLLRVNKIFGSGSHRHVVVKEKDVVLPFSILLILSVILLTLWTIFSPLQYHRVYESSVDGFDRLDESYATCFPTDPTWDELIFLIMLIVIYFIALLYANIQAYLARNIPVEFSESKYIAISMAIMLEGFLLGIPILVMVDSSPPARYFVRSLLVMIVSLAVLLPIFIPKIRFLREWKENEAKRAEQKRSSAVRNREFFARASPNVSSLKSSGSAYSKAGLHDSVKAEMGSHVSRDSRVSFKEDVVHINVKEHAKQEHAIPEE